ncbi:MAG: AI-2E family transporter [Deltaproteobacteria bacterium]|nr:AI-2E family transporter [Deltaproteobacteria bacterium]
MAKQPKKKPTQRSPGGPTPPPASAPPVLPPTELPPAAASASLRPLIIDEKLFLTIVAIAVGVFFLYLVRGVLVPMIFVVIVTFLGAPFVARLERRGVARGVGAAVFLLLVGAGIAFLIALVAPKLVSDIAALVQKLPDLLSAAAVQIEKRTGVEIPTTWRDFSSEASQELLDQLSPFAAKGGALVGQGALGLFKGAASAAGVLAQVALVPIIAYFVLTELPGVQRFARTLAPAKLRATGDRYLPLVDDALSGLVRGQLTVVALMSVVYIVGLGISGVPLAAAIGILAGFAYLIPYASATVALILSVSLTLLERGWDDGKLPILGAIITCVVLQILEGYVFTPRIVGEKAGLSPLAALLAVLLGGSAAGFLGVVFALPVGAVIALVLREELKSRSAGGAPPEPVPPAVV